MGGSYDVVVIGGGPGGYVCAIRAAQLGMKVACVEKRGALGGTCLNVGCIPSKALLHASELFDSAANEFAGFGIKTGKVALDLPAMMAQKDKSVTDLTKGVEFLFRKNKVDYLVGAGRVAGPGKVAVTDADGNVTEYSAKAIVIATGSDVAPLPGVAIDEERIVSSTGALSLKSVPKRLLVVGAGYIGLEMGSVWRRLGSEVTVVEFLDRITPGLDGEVAKQFQRTLTKQGFAFKLSTKVTGVAPKGKTLSVTLEPAKGGAAETVETDAVLVAIGRRPFTDGLGLEEAGVRLDDKKRIVVDAHWRSSVDGVYAIGDAIAGPMLAHKAMEEGAALAERLAGQASEVNYSAIPAVVYTKPEVASVGATEEELKAAGTEYRAGKFPFTAVPRARINHETEGFIKILADKRTDRVLGVHMIGPDVGNLVGEVTLAIEFGASAEDIARTCHAHPTLSEGIKEAALAVDGRPIHM
jgi:dihydrolipoamide dehydrogenase